jgi:Na+/proline symporter
MLTQAGVTDSKKQLQVNVILSCWSLVVAVIGSLLMDVVGRRTMTLTAIGGMIVTLYIFGGLTKGIPTSYRTAQVEISTDARQLTHQARINPPYTALLP